LTGRRHNILLLTATIIPPRNVPGLVLTDPLRRLREYDQALRFYLHHLGRCADAIVFAENSGADLSPLRATARAFGASERVEFLSVQGLDYAPELGKGFGEFKLLDHVMSSSLACLSSTTSVIWKITGRYRVRNISRFIAHSPRSFSVYLDMRQWRGPWVDLRLMAWTVAGYARYLRRVYLRLAERGSNGRVLHPEQRMWEVVHAWPPGRDVVTRFVMEPFVDGARGSDGRNWTRGKGIVMYWARSIGRVLVPTLAI